MTQSYRPCADAVRAGRPFIMGCRCRQPAWPWSLQPGCALPRARLRASSARSEEHTSELQSQSNLVCRLLLEKKKPLHSVVIREGTVVVRAHNATVGRLDPTSHARLLALQQALSLLRTDRLSDCNLYVTLEPC